MESSSMPKALAEAMAASAFSTLKRPAMPMRQLSCRPLCRVVKAKPGSAFSMFVSVQFSSRLSPSLLPKVMTRCAWARARSSTRCAWSHVAVDDGDFAVLHQLQLAGKIVLKVGVLQRADVVLSDVEEHPQVKIDPIHPVQLVRLGGNLHRQKGQAAVPGSAQSTAAGPGTRG